MIEFRKVKKAFNNKIVLDETNFEIPAGQITFVLGKSGTGKSVLLKLIVGLLLPDTGDIFVDGMSTRGFLESDFLKVRQICGMVFQQPALFDSMSVFENIAYGLRRFSINEAELNDRVNKALDLVDLEEEVKTLYPNQISYGMQKRVSLARSIVLQPKILLFDEPTTGLDPITTTSVSQLIKNLSRTLNTTALVVSHDMKSALEVADHVLVLDQGKVVFQGSSDQIKKSTQPLVQDFLEEARENQ